MRLLCPSVQARLEALVSFAPEAPLLRWSLVTLNDDPGARRPVLLARYLKLDERIAGYLLGSDAVDSRLAPLIPRRQREGEPELARETAESLGQWADAWPDRWMSDGPVVLLHGRYGTGARDAAKRLADALGRPLLMLSLPEMLASELPLGQGLALAEREAILSNSLLAWCDVDGVLRAEADGSDERRIFVQSLARGRVPTILLARNAWEPAHELDRRPFLHLGLPEPTYAERRGYWAAGLNGSLSSVDDQDLGALASRFRLTQGQIGDAVSRAATLAWSRRPTDSRVEVGDVDDACRRQAQHRLGALARKIEPRHSWEDIVLPGPQMTALRLITATVRQRGVVYGDWGFDRKLSLGKGLLALFSGPSGTGKTMAAGIIASDLGLDLYKIDLSAVVSKYIGETEKNLERIFSEAQDSDAILFFDEADALFGKRSEVRDAHDRYANIETAYLLQRTEEYSGLVILASNVKKNMDEAFVRRLHFIVEFPLPEEAERLEIWRRTFPREAPREADIDLSFLARKLKLPGGNIRNIILTAAFLAADQGQSIGMRHLVCGASYEFQKMGKLIVESDFERYFDLVRLEGGRHQA
jgi:AAA+ superfamily predicted ATPase